MNKKERLKLADYAVSKLMWIEVINAAFLGLSSLVFWSCGCNSIKSFTTNKLYEYIDKDLREF